MSRVISSTAGTRVEPKDSYTFIVGTTATFKTTITNNGVPTKVDVGTIPHAKIMLPRFMQDNNLPFPQIIANIPGTLTPGQEFEYKFDWDVTTELAPNDEYIVSYEANLGGLTMTFGDEFFTLTHVSGQVDMKVPSYATVDDVRKKKFNIDDYLPEIIKKDINDRNNLIEDHLFDAAQRLREELSLFKQRGNTANYRLFCVYYTVWSIMLAARGEDGSSVSSESIGFWRSEWERILAQEKRKCTPQGISFGRG